MLKSLLKNTDYVVLVTVLLLFVIGVIAIFSAGYNTDVNKDEYIKQIMWMAAVFVMMIVIWAVDYKVFDIAGYILYGINLILLMLVLFMPSLMGASSWFNLGGILYQPSELMKIGFIICAAKLATIYKNNINQNEKNYHDCSNVTYFFTPCYFNYVTTRFWNSNGFCCNSYIYVV